MDPDLKGVKIKEDNLYKQNFYKIFQNDIKTPLKIKKHNVLQKDPYFMFPVLYHLMKLNIFSRLFTGYLLGSGSASVHADPDPGGISLFGSMRIRIRNMLWSQHFVTKLSIHIFRTAPGSGSALICQLNTVILVLGGKISVKDKP